VGDLRAVVAIDGAVAHLKAGESRAGVRVVAVDPPRVTFEHDTRRWTESLFESCSDTDATAASPGDPNGGS
jgi:hypothetical protein